ncbi:MAG TPA: NADH-quinone oxidoreductase subunit C [Candidatus Saccharimonadales bacterium]|nr:NADH-quinone oxidoreductase subunit C [Candidatus Saccharimonadales bacterium]
MSSFEPGTAPPGGPAFAAPRPGSETVLHIDLLPVDDWPDRLRDLRRRDGAVFVDLFGGPVSPARTTALTVLLARPDQQDWLALRDWIAPEAGYPSLTSVIPAADWYERELFETHHVAAVGHPHLHPLGHGADVAADRLLADLPLAPATAGVVDLPLGPVRSGIVESGHYTLRSVGEQILDVRLQLAYKHRGVETMATNLSWSLLPLLVERISGTDAVAHGLACAAAIEMLTGQVPTPRAHGLRAIAAELERLHDHVAFQADLCQATGLAVAQAQFEIVRERLLRLAGRLVGHRYLFGYVQPGGVATDFDADALADLTQTVSDARRDIRQLGAMVAASGSHQDRLQGTGRVTPEDAANLALTGPVARASGLDVDARRDLPYGAYAGAAVPVALARGGDAAARATVRLEEALNAADLILELADRLPRGPATVPQALGPTPLPPSTVGLGWTEGSRGTEVHWIETDAAGDIVRYRVRSASFACWQAFARSIPGGNILTDFPIIEQSFGLSFAGSDR